MKLRVMRSGHTPDGQHFYEIAPEEDWPRDDDRTVDREEARALVETGILRGWWLDGLPPEAEDVVALQLFISETYESDAPRHDPLGNSGRQRPSAPPWRPSKPRKSLGDVVLWALGVLLVVAVLAFWLWSEGLLGGAPDCAHVPDPPLICRVT